MIKFFFIFLIGINVVALHAEEDYDMCGPPPGIISKLLTDATKIREKCFDQINEENQEKVRREVAALDALRKQLDQEIKKTAVSVTISTVECAPGVHKTRDPNLVKRCQEAVRAKNAVITRIDKLMGWSEQYKISVDQYASSPDQGRPDPSTYPCPSQEELDKMKMARVFNQRLNDYWIRCMSGT